MTRSSSVPSLVLRVAGWAPSRSGSARAGSTVRTQPSPATVREARLGQRYLVDGDAAGYVYRDKLVAAGVASTSIVEFSKKGATTPASPEDAVSTDAFLQAINLLLTAGGTPVMTASDVPRRERWSAVRAWTRQHGKPEPGKKALAQALLDRRHNGLLDGDGKHRLQRIDDALRKVLMAGTDP